MIDSSFSQEGGAQATPQRFIHTGGGDVRRSLVLSALAMLTISLALLSVGVGQVRIDPPQIAAIVLNEFGIETRIVYTPVQDAVLIPIRLPRVLLGLLIGAALALAGASAQGLFRSPLADPGLIGISGGAALAVTLVIGVARATEATIDPLIYPPAAFIGALAVTALIYRLATIGGRSSVLTMILAGVAINAIAGAAIGLVSFIFGGITAAQDLTFWSLGSLERANWRSIGLFALPITILSLIVLRGNARTLNALLLGDSEAGHLGVNVERTRRVIMAASALAVGMSVALAGIIGFVGLIVPYMVRRLVGPDHRVVLPGSALLGASLVTGIDLLARTLSDFAVPLGVITALIGGPIFLWMLLRDRARGMFA
jgi:iron complex transport system permease protein